MKKMLLAALIFSGVFTAAALEFSDAEIVLVPKASIVAESAAADLQYHLQKMTGGKFPIVRKRSNNYAAAIYLGKAARQAGMPVDKLKKDGFFRVVKGKNIYIAGNDDPQVGRRDFVYIYFFVQKRGTMHGVYDFLESLGVLWPAPGTKYEYIPRKKSIKLADSVKVDNPVFIERGATGIWNFKKFPDAGEYTKNPSEAVTWAMRLRISNIRGIATGSHSEQFLKLDKVWFKKYPERFQKMKNGKRNPRYCCWSSPEVREAWLAAADGFFSGKKPSEVGLGRLKSWRGQNKNDEFLIDPMDHGAANDGRC
ncbi:MAG: hypothetical protein IKA87_08735, partial [Lentisphaeria bacterium]|nr:hypothetical protein [Lentisphaeria bacterium]